MASASWHSTPRGSCPQATWPYQPSQPSARSHREHTPQSVAAPVACRSVILTKWPHSSLRVPGAASACRPSPTAPHGHPLAGPAAQPPARLPPCGPGAASAPAVGQPAGQGALPPSRALGAATPPMGAGPRGSLRACLRAAPPSASSPWAPPPAVPPPALPSPPPSGTWLPGSRSHLRRPPSVPEQVPSGHLSDRPPGAVGEQAGTPARPCTSRTGTRSACSQCSGRSHAQGTSWWRCSST